MRIIKEFSNFNNNNNNWHVKMTSQAGTNGLSNNQIESSLHSNIDPDNVKFHKEFNAKMDSKYDNPNARWQTDKRVELDKLFNDNLSYQIDDDIVNITVEYDVEFPNDWDRGDIIGWCEGFNKISKAYHYSHSERIVKRYKDDPTGIIRDENHSEIKDFLDEIASNQKFEITKI